MAIAKIKKIELIGLQKDKDNLSALLQKLGIVELISMQESPPTSNLRVSISPTNLLEIEEAVNYLASFKEKTSLLGAIIKLKPRVYAKQLEQVIAHFDYQDLIKQLLALRDHFRILNYHRDQLIQERHLLAPWQNLALALDEIRPTPACGILLGILSNRDYTVLLEDCQKEGIKLFCEVTNRDSANTYLVILYLQEKFEHLEGLLKKYRFNFVTLSRHRGSVKERILEINREVLVLDDQIQDTKTKISQLSQEQFKLMVIYDYLANVKRRQEIDKNLAKQEFTFYLTGWIRNKDVKLLEKELASRFKDVVIFVSEPKHDEIVPVELENKRLIEPFEFITKIYGMPKYHEIDPTPFLAPFFFLYFGFCVSDVGYGLILSLFSWFILKKFKLGPQGLRFFRLFLYCGISTMIIGSLTGSWFGNLFDLLYENNRIFLPLKKFKDTLIILDPLKEPTKLLGIALSFGIIQVWFGNLVAGIGNLKNKRYLAVLLDQVPMFTFLFGLTGLGFIFLKLLDNRNINLFKYASLMGAIALLITQGRAEKGIGAKIFYGAFNLYNTLSGYLSDILSYSRLWALGLVTTVMANTINLISIQFSGVLITIIPILARIYLIKILLSALTLITIFIFGHTVSLLMNLLGAFVHPLRLQFVEFFSKFFKPGGNPFKPFRIETKYIDIS